MRVVIGQMLAFALRRAGTLVGAYFIEQGWVESATWEEFLIKAIPAAVPVLVDLGIHLYARMNAFQKEQARTKVVQFVQRISTSTVE